MKNLIIIASLLLSLPIMAQTKVVKKNAVKANNFGITYSLPKTSLVVDAEVTKVTCKAGPYYKYAEKYLGVKDAITEDKVYYQDLGRKSVTVLTEERYSAMLDDTYLYREVSIEGINCDAAENGINIMVYDNELQEMVDNAGMNASDGYAFMRY